MKVSTLLFAATVAVAFFHAQAEAQDCQKVSVIGDGTFCIKGPICSGTPSSKGGDKCPQVGDTAVADCLPSNPSYNKATGKCTAPVPAECKPTNGVWACNWDLSKLPGAPAPTPAVTGTAPAPAKDCQNISVVGDGTFCVKGPVCSGTPSNKGGDKCPVVGDTAVADCQPYHPSFNKVTGKCTAPVPADCKPLATGSWGCVWDLSKLPPPPAPTPAVTAAKDCTDVSVVGDGTFCIKGPVCSGTPNSKGGDKCPQVGDTAVAGCNPFNPSYNKTTGKCTAPVPAECKPTNGVWACNWDVSKLPKRN